MNSFYDLDTFSTRNARTRSMAPHSMSKPFLLSAHSLLSACFLLSAYFLAVQSYKRMRLTASVYGICVGKPYVCNVFRPQVWPRTHMNVTTFFNVAVARACLHCMALLCMKLYPREQFPALQCCTLKSLLFSVQHYKAVGSGDKYCVVILGHFFFSA